jgi:hypothetical protein
MKKLLLTSLVFGASVAAQATILLQDNFNYADGDITNVAAPLWNYHSGGGTAATALNVVSGRAFINQNDTTSGLGDANRLLSSSFDPATDNTSVIYVGFTVNFAALPFNTGTSTAGSYFAHLKSSAANEFYARIGANTEGAAAGTFRLAVATEAWANGAGTVEFAQDLTLNTDYLVVMKYDLFTDRATLWVDPLNEASTSVVSTDAPGYAAGGVINAFAFRQGTSNSTGAPGDIYIDNLAVGTAFGEVVPEPSVGAMGLLALVGMVGRKMGRRS